MGKLLLILLFIFIVTVVLIAQSAAAIIPPEQKIDWTNVGIPEGITNYPNSINIMDFGAKADGKSDDFKALIKAITACEAGKAVFLPAGNYLIKSPITIEKSIVIRGDGKDKTYLIFNLDEASSVDAISLVLYDSGNWQKAKSGYEKGSVKIEVETPSLFIPGKFAEITEDNDPKKMYTSPNWNQTWAQNAVGQIFRVNTIEGNSIIVDEPLHITFDSKLNPRLRPLEFVKNAGIEDMHLKRIDKGDGNMITIKNAAYCWVKSVESEYVMRSHVALETSYKCEVRDCYFHHAYDYGGGGHGYGVEMEHHTANCLVENNKFFHLRHSMMVHLGANGNVFGYNISKESFATADNDPGTTICDISVHGHYPFMNLFEGNIVQKIEISDYWGPCGPGNTFLRNTVQNGGIIINDASDYQNLIGNILINGNQSIVIKQNVDVKTIILYGNRDSKRPKEKRGIPNSLYKVQTQIIQSAVPTKSLDENER